MNFEPSSSMKVYVGSGGRNASLAAILDGQGGQQNKQQNSLKLNPFIVSRGELRTRENAVQHIPHWDTVYK